MHKSRAIHVAACAVEVRQASSEIELIPAGKFRGIDGRPHDAPHWLLDPESAQSWLAALRQRKTKFIVDYEHQTLLSKENGQPAPAAATFTGVGLEIRDGALWATDVEWTAKARAAIESGEYHYISPVFFYRRPDGVITGLFNASLTNTPNIDGMERVFRAAASQFINPQEEAVDKEIRKALGLAEDASDEDVIAACKQVVADRDQAKAGQVAAEEKLAAAKQQAGDDPDPERFVSVEVANDLRDKVAELTRSINSDKVEGMVSAALEDGRLLPAQEDWARKLGAKDVAALSAYLESAEPIAGLRQRQSGGKRPATNSHGLTDQQMAICRQAGIDPADYKKSLDELEETA